MSGRRLVLLRHGQTSWNAEQRAQGHADVPLDAVGRRQAERVAPLIAAYDPAVLVSSDLARARETAAYVEKATGLTCAEDPRLREYDVGARQGLTLAEFGAQMGTTLTSWWDANQHFEVPGAETHDDVWARVVPALRDLVSRTEPGQTAVAVMHGACLKLGLTGLLGWPQDQAGTLSSLGNCHWALVVEAVPEGADEALVDEPQDAPHGPLRLAGYGLGPDF